jgi:hypothetical protein
MKSKTFLKLFVPTLFLGIIFTNLSFGLTLSKIYSPKIALGAATVVCDCSLLGTNHLCAANNYGAECAPGGSSNCADFNSNCEG